MRSNLPEPHSILRRLRALTLVLVSGAVAILLLGCAGEGTHPEEAQVDPAAGNSPAAGSPAPADSGTSAPK